MIEISSRVVPPRRTIAANRTPSRDTANDTMSRPASPGARTVCTAFAVATLRRWWTLVGQVAYPNAKRLLISADAGGSNGYRVRLWKTELAQLASDTGLAITVCHYPPGTSKWNKIEHRLFSAITSNWRGRPLTSHQVVVELISATSTRTGLTVHAEADTGNYPRGVKISDAQMAAIAPQLKPDRFHGEWNYTVKPARSEQHRLRNS